MSEWGIYPFLWVVCAPLQKSRPQLGPLIKTGLEHHCSFGLLELQSAALSRRRAGGTAAQCEKRKNIRSWSFDYLVSGLLSPWPIVAQTGKSLHLGMKSGEFWWVQLRVHFEIPSETTLSVEPNTFFSCSNSKMSLTSYFWKVREKRNTYLITSWHFIPPGCRYLLASTALDERNCSEKTCSEALGFNLFVLQLSELKHCSGQSFCCRSHCITITLTKQCICELHAVYSTFGSEFIFDCGKTLVCYSDCDMTCCCLQATAGLFVQVG